MKYLLKTLVLLFVVTASVESIKRILINEECKLNEMEKRIVLSVVILCIFCVSAQEVTSQFTKESISTTVEKVENWQFNNLSSRNWWTWPSEHVYGDYLIDWENGAFFSGVMDWYSVEKNEKFLNKLIQIGEINQWSVRPRVWDANVLWKC